MGGRTRNLRERLDAVTTTWRTSTRQGPRLWEHPHAETVARLAGPLLSPASTRHDAARARLAALQVGVLLREPEGHTGALVAILGAVRDAERDAGQVPDPGFWEAVGLTPADVDGMRAASIAGRLDHQAL